MQDRKIPSFACEDYYINMKVKRANELGELFQKAYGEGTSFEHDKKKEDDELFTDARGEFE